MKEISQVRPAPVLVWVVVRITTGVPKWYVAIVFIYSSIVEAHAVGVLAIFR